MRRAVSLAAALLVTTGLAAQTAKPPTPAEALKPAQGTWVFKTFNGQPAGEGEVLLIITGDKYAQSISGTVSERGTLVIDPAKKPMTIDLTIQEGDDAGKLQLGLVEIAGDTITLKLNVPGSPTRPKDLSIEEGFFVVVGDRRK
jgi:uncharacterized protein (TIGR03067 family)